MRQSHFLPLVASFILFACSGSTTTGVSTQGGGDSLFVAPSGEATPDDIYGTWGGAMKRANVTFDTRMRFAKDRATVAAKCQLDDGRTTDVASVTVTARVDANEITLLESRRDERKLGDFSCYANAHPETLKACADDFVKTNCFELSGTSLTIYGEAEQLELTKLAD